MSRAFEVYDNFAFSKLKHIVLCSKSFAETLKRLGVKAESILYEGKTHTDVFLQVTETTSILSFLMIIYAIH